MPEITSYRHGVPNWVDVASPDPAAAAAFYEQLFGWEAEDQGQEAGNYHMMRMRGLDVAGLGPLQSDGMPPLWSTYIAVDDLDAAFERATATGGQVIVPPMDVLDAGRMAFVVDTSGAAVGLWQAGRTIGSQLVNEPGTPVWHELTTRDATAAQSFYATVLGWTYEPMDETGSYHLVQVQGRTTAGIMPMEGDAWGDLPSHWMVYFAVEDTDATAARARELGGAVSVEPFDTPVGRAAVLNDPTGPAFSVIALHQVDDPGAGWRD